MRPSSPFCGRSAWMRRRCSAACMRRTTKLRPRRCAAPARRRACFTTTAPESMRESSRLCLVIGADLTTYLQVDNPAQRRILALCARVSDDDATSWPLGVDGCGIPVYATGLRNAALVVCAAWRRCAGSSDADARALEVVRDAMLAYPQYVAGTGQFDTELMIAGVGNLVSKAGAEGVAAAGALAERLRFRLEGRRRRVASEGAGLRERARASARSRREEGRPTRSICAAGSV